MKSKLIIFLILSGQVLFAGGIKDKAELQIKEITGSGTMLTFSKIAIDPKVKKGIENKSQQKFFRDDVYVWKVNRRDSLIAYAILDNVLGKSMPITFLTVFDTTGSLLATRVVKYREAYGGAISNHNWLDQFKNRSIENNNREIDTITGATISVQAISKGIKKLILLFPFIQKEIN